MFAKPALAAALLAATSSGEILRFKDRCLADLTKQVPAILASQDRKSGRFGTGIWIVTDQNVMLPLAAAWATTGSSYYHSPDLLEAIMAAGDALIDDQDANGRWVFRKKDGSTWGDIYMPWIYSRWARSFALIRDAMPAERRTRWEKALTLGYTGISKELATGRIHNIPSHHAMGLWFAGEALHRPEWKEQSREFLRKVAAHQHPDGYWSENKGPVVLYGYVYVDALGVYYAVSKDEAVLPALRKSGVFHSYFTYPDGSDVETIDERNYYHPQLRAPNTGFTVTPEGRVYLARQLQAWKGSLPADDVASLLLYGQEGDIADGALSRADFDYVLGQGDASVHRRGPWYLVVSALTAPVPNSRWIQDRQNFVSVYHDDFGLILGGGNTKLQPLLSSFTSGDPALVRFRGEENPDFQPPPGITHIPTAARLLGGGAIGVELSYGDRKGRIELDVKGPDRLEYKLSGDPALTAHVVMLPRTDPLAAAFGAREVLIGTPFKGDAGARPSPKSELQLIWPSGTTLHWPVSPFNPYAKDGHAEPADSRIVVDVPLTAPQTVVVKVNRK